MIVAINNARMAIYGELFPPINLPEALHELEAAIIERTVEACGGNKKMAAQILKLKRSTLVMKRRLYNKKGWIGRQWRLEISAKPEEIPNENVSTIGSLTGND